LLGIGVALALELMHRRVRSAADMVQVLDLPVLARVGPAGGGRSRMQPTLLPPASPLSIGHGSSA
jgi:hypothetical protein